jgi:inactivated superfamily I helicase
VGGFRALEAASIALQHSRRARTPKLGAQEMKFVIPFCATMICAGAAQAQTDLTAYADANGNIDVQKLTCKQLAGTWQEDADFLTVWYSGWYNGLADYSKMKVDRAKELEHRVIVYCKAHQDKKVITAMDINIKQMRKEAGIKVIDEK